MKTVKLNILAVRRTNEGGIAVKTKATTFNESQTDKGFAWHRLTQKQAEYLAGLTLGVKSAQALFAAIMKSRGQAVLTCDVKVIKKGESWVNQFTGETGIYKDEQFPEGKNEIERGSISNFDFAESVYDVMFAAALAPQPVVVEAVVGEPQSAENLAV